MAALQDQHPTPGDVVEVRRKKNQEGQVIETPEVFLVIDFIPGGGNEGLDVHEIKWQEFQERDSFLVPSTFWRNGFVKIGSHDQHAQTVIEVAKPSFDRKATIARIIELKPSVGEEFPDVVEQVFGLGVKTIKPAQATDEQLSSLLQLCEQF